MKNKLIPKFSLVLKLLLLTVVSQCRPSLPSNQIVIPKVRGEHVPPTEASQTLRKVFSEGATLSSLLQSAGLPAAEVHHIGRAARALVDLSKIKSNAQLEFSYRSDSPCCNLQFLEKITLELEQGRLLVLTPEFIKGPLRGFSAKGWIGEIRELPQESRLVRFSAVLGNASLWKSAADAGIDPGAMNAFVELFSWDIDFSRELREGATLSFIIQEKLIEGKHLSWSYLRAAEFFTGDRLVQVVRFDGDASHPGGYFRPDGQSLKRMFLKSPIEAARVTSGFSMARFHPIFKTNRPHMGVDYGAPEGTPIRAIGSGVVETASYREGSGNYLQIKHNGTYETAYKHLSAFAKNIIPGSKVEQGEIIGYVGSTGWATGPHLHFELYRNGAYVDPLNEVFPSAAPLPSEALGAFKKSSQFWLSQLPKKQGMNAWAKQ
ncbi:MAG: peptidoglycan DD-metalloendopeptidase family protein [Pseudomonadota bacterium]